MPLASHTRNSAQGLPRHGAWRAAPPPHSDGRERLLCRLHTLRLARLYRTVANIGPGWCCGAPRWRLRLGLWSLLLPCVRNGLLARALVSVLVARSAVVAN